MASPQKDVLVVSFIGYNTQEFPLKGKTNVTIQLSQNVNELDAVEIVAFGTQKKESVIGSITTLSPKSLRVPSSNMTTALAGQVAGIILIRHQESRVRTMLAFLYVVSHLSDLTPVL